VRDPERGAVDGVEQAIDAASQEVLDGLNRELVA
jgi:hypothetical protein